MTIAFRKILNETHEDPEHTHSSMDEIMVNTLEKLGYENAMKIFKDSERYYA